MNHTDRPELFNKTPETFLIENEMNREEQLVTPISLIHLDNWSNLTN